MNKFLKTVGYLALSFCILIGVLLMGIAYVIGSDNSSEDLQNAGFGGSISDSADVPDWLVDLINQGISEYGCSEVTPALIAAQLYSESGFNPDAQSKDPDTGAPIADGIAQFIPGTWKAHGVDGDKDGDKDVWDPADAVPAAVAYDCYLAGLVDEVPGDATDNMLAAYNAGPYAVQKYKGIPPYDETRNYVKKIRDLAAKWTDAVQEGSGTVTGSGKTGRVIAAAQDALGTYYQWGGNCKRPYDRKSGNGCDCSSLVKMAWSAAGVNLPRTTYDQVNEGSPVRSVNDLRPGDLLFSEGSGASPNHVALYLGNGQVIDAPRTGMKVRIKPLSYWTSQIVAMRHIG